MVLDRDYPPTRRDLVILAVGLSIMGIIGILLFGGFLPGLHPSFAQNSIETIDGHQYYVLQSALLTPFLANSSGPWNVTFHNVTFRLWITNWYAFTGGIVHGVGTEPNGSAYPFALGTTNPNGSRTTLYLSPDRGFGAYWTGGPFGGPEIQLLVKV